MCVCVCVCERGSVCLYEQRQAPVTLPHESRPRGVWWGMPKKAPARTPPGATVCVTKPGETVWQASPLLSSLPPPPLSSSSPLFVTSSATRRRIEDQVDFPEGSKPPFVNLMGSPRRPLANMKCGWLFFSPSFQLSCAGTAIDSSLLE